MYDYDEEELRKRKDSELSDILKEFSEKLREQLTELSEGEELPDAWKRKVKAELTKLGTKIANFKGDGLKRYDERVALCMYWITVYRNELEEAVTKHSSPMEYKQRIADETGYTVRNVEILYEEYKQHWLNTTLKPSDRRFKPLPAKKRAAIEIGTAMAHEEDIWR